VALTKPTKKGLCLALSLGLLEQFHQIFYRITLSPFPHPSATFRPVSEEIYPKMFPRLITISASRQQVALDCFKSF